MLFIVLCHDKPNSLELRMKTRPDHLAYLQDAGARVKVAGPTLKNGKPAGSMILVDGASEMAVKLFAENDPYNKVGLFEKVEIIEWKAGIGDWLPEGEGL